MVDSSKGGWIYLAAHRKWEHQGWIAARAPPRRHFGEVRNSHSWWGNVASWFTKGNSHQCLLWTAQLKSQNFVLFSRACLVWTSQFGVSGFPFRVRHLGSKALLVFCFHLEGVPCFLAGVRKHPAHQGDTLGKSRTHTHGGECWIMFLQSAIPINTYCGPPNWSLRILLCFPVYGVSGFWYFFVLPKVGVLGTGASYDISLVLSCYNCCSNVPFSVTHNVSDERERERERA